MKRHKSACFEKKEQLYMQLFLFWLTHRTMNRELHNKRFKTVQYVFNDQRQIIVFISIIHGMPNKIIKL